MTRNHKPWFVVEVKSSANKRLSPSLEYFKTILKIDHAFQVDFESDFIQRDCFREKRSIRVPAATLLSQFIWVLHMVTKKPGDMWKIPVKDSLYHPHSEPPYMFWKYLPNFEFDSRRIIPPVLCQFLSKYQVKFYSEHQSFKIFSKLLRGVPQNNVHNLWQIAPYARTPENWQYQWSLLRMDQPVIIFCAHNWVDMSWYRLSA